MHKKLILLFSLLYIGAISAQAQTFNIVIKGGHVIDPRNNINGVMDIAINDGKIAQVAKNIDL